MWMDFAIFLSACFVAGSTGSLFPPGSWYAQLKKPTWTPPNWLFPVAWITLYLLMAYSGARLTQVSGAGTALALWSLQIALNALWTPVFFGLQKIKLAFYCIVGLWLAVALCVAVFWQYSWISAVAFVPYLAWVSVAGALNLAVLRLNPEHS